MARSQLPLDIYNLWAAQSERTEVISALDWVTREKLYFHLPPLRQVWNGLTKRHNGSRWWHAQTLFLQLKNTIAMLQKAGQGQRRVERWYRDIKTAGRHARVQWYVEWSWIQSYYILIISGWCAGQPLSVRTGKNADNTVEIMFPSQADWVWYQHNKTLANTRWI